MKQAKYIKSTVSILIFIFAISYSYIPLRGIVSAYLLDLISYAYHQLKLFQFFYFVYPTLSGLLTSIVLGGVLGLPFGAILKKRTIQYSILVSLLSSLWIVEKLQEVALDFQRHFGSELPPVQFLDFLDDYYVDFILFILVFALCCSVGARIFQRLTRGGVGCPSVSG